MVSVRGLGSGKHQAERRPSREAPRWEPERGGGLGHETMWWLEKVEVESVPRLLQAPMTSASPMCPWAVLSAPNSRSFPADKQQLASASDANCVCTAPDASWAGRSLLRRRLLVAEIVCPKTTLGIGRNSRASCESARPPDARPRFTVNVSAGCEAAPANTCKQSFVRPVGRPNKATSAERVCLSVRLAGRRRPSARRAAARLVDERTCWPAKSAAALRFGRSLARAALA